MRFSHATRNDASVAEVYAVLTSAVWSDQLAEHLNDDARTVSRVVAPDGAVTLVTSRRLPSGIPPFLQKFLPSDPRVVVTDVWSGPRGGAHDCSWTAEITGAPARIRGTQRISPIEGGNLHEIAGEVKVSVPFIGSKAEAFIAEQVLGLVVAEVAVTEQVLRGS